MNERLNYLQVYFSQIMIAMALVQDFFYFFTFHLVNMVASTLKFVVLIGSHSICVKSLMYSLERYYPLLRMNNTLNRTQFTTTFEAEMVWNTFLSSWMKMCTIALNYIFFVEFRLHNECFISLNHLVWKFFQRAVTQMKDQTLDIS